MSVFTTNLESEEQAEALELVLAERDNQDEKWGEQNHPIASAWNAVALEARDRHHTSLGVTADKQRQYVNLKLKQGTASWLMILMEEVAELNEAETPDEVRSELVQVAAVALAALESELRREAREAEKTFEVGQSVWYLSLLWGRRPARVWRRNDNGSYGLSYTQGEEPLHIGYVWPKSIEPRP